MKNNVKDITLISLLGVIIAISGAFKIPGIIPGTEFQMSAPIAIGICSTFGFKKYINAGIIGSFINLMMGTHIILNVIVSMVFRVVAGGIINIFGNRMLIISIAGPIGTIIGRAIMSQITGANLNVLLISAFPGMIYTALSSYFIYKSVEKITTVTPYKSYIKNLKVN